MLSLTRVNNHLAILFFQNGIIHRVIISVDWHAALGENTDTFIRLADSYFPNQKKFDNSYKRCAHLSMDSGALDWFLFLLSMGFILGSSTADLVLRGLSLSAAY